MDKEKEKRIFRKKLKETKRLWKEENKDKFSKERKRDLFNQRTNQIIFDYLGENE